MKIVIIISYQLLLICFCLKATVIPVAFGALGMIKRKIEPKEASMLLGATGFTIRHESTPKSASPLGTGHVLTEVIAV